MDYDAGLKNQEQLKSIGRIDSILRNIFRGANIAGMVLLLVMMLLTVADVIMRSLPFINHPIKGATEITEYIMVCLVLGTAWCMFTGRTIRMDMIVSRFSVRVQAIVDTITYVLGFLILVALTRQAFVETIASYKVEQPSPVLRWPNYPVRAILALSFVLLTISVIAVIVKNIRKAVKG
jgi:TRAP-type mannitol/chloroaromatic compound transport system permease small subunit